MSLPSPITKLFAVLNADLAANSQPPVSPSDFTSIVPQPYSGLRRQRNTMIHLDPPLSSPLTGRSTLFYDRIDMGTITGITVEKGTATTLIELLPAINESLGIALAVGDLEPVATIPASGAMTITASATNLIYYGTLTFTLAV